MEEVRLEIFSRKEVGLRQSRIENGDFVLNRTLSHQEG